MPGAQAALADAPDELREAFLRDRLVAARPAARTWSVAWGVTYGALTVGQLAAVPFYSDHATRSFLVAGAATSALGVLQIVLLPVVPPEPPPPSPGDCAVLGRLEGTLARAAQNQRLGSGAIAQTGNVIVNAAFGVAAGFAGGWRAGALTAGIGWVIGEAQLLSQPTALIHDLDRYRAADLGAAAPAASAVRTPGGATLALTWRF